MKKYLFIGGKADGKMIEAKNEYWEHWEPIPFPIYPKEDDISYRAEIKKEIYRKIRWGGGSEFYALASMGNDDIEKRLLENYNPRKEVELNDYIKKLKIKLSQCLSFIQALIDNPSPTNKLWSKIWKFCFDLRLFLHKDEKEKEKSN